VRQYLLRRLAQGAAVLFIVSAVVFAIVHAAPGGPALLNNPDVDPRMAREMETLLGLDHPGSTPAASNAGEPGVLSARPGHRGVAVGARSHTLLSGTALMLAVVLAIRWA
jgi:ABC-type microcin C transport system permease subunit YejB